MQLLREWNTPSLWLSANFISRPIELQWYLTMRRNSFNVALTIFGRYWPRSWSPTDPTAYACRRRMVKLIASLPTMSRRVSHRVNPVIILYRRLGQLCLQIKCSLVFWVQCDVCVCKVVRCAKLELRGWRWFGVCHGYVKSCVECSHRGQKCCVLMKRSGCVKIYFCIDDTVIMGE